MNCLIPEKAENHQKVNISDSSNIITRNVTFITQPLRQSTIEVENKNKPSNNEICVISRADWIAEAPREVTPLPEPVKYVIIAHTATENGLNPSQNALLVKLIQTFHMDSLKWADIAYNFLIGNDGNVYEGRGWNIQGAHTYGYNKKSICIAFIGCYMNHLPSAKALNTAKLLINFGVQNKYIPNDYILVGHCQCSPIESPGFCLYSEIKTWPRWQELTINDSRI